MQVLNEIVLAAEKNADGKVDYHHFITALRSNTMPNKPYSKKFKHKLASNPDQPCGPPSIK